MAGTGWFELKITRGHRMTVDILRLEAIGMNFSPLPDESDEGHFNRVIVPILGSREELQISFGVKQTLESRPEALHESAAKENLPMGFDSDGRPDSLTATIAARFDDLTAAEKAVRRICLDSGYDYTCSSFVIELDNT